MYETMMEQWLRQYGVGTDYQGFSYCIFSVDLAINHPETLRYVTKSIYPETAKHFQTNSSCVERNIRTVVEIVWRNGGMEFFSRITGEAMSRRPTNTKFLRIMSEYIAKAALEHQELAASGECADCPKVKKLLNRIEELKTEIRRLEENEQWMHDLIWRMILEQKEKENNHSK